MLRLFAFNRCNQHCTIPTPSVVHSFVIPQCISSGKSYTIGGLSICETRKFPFEEIREYFSATTPTVKDYQVSVGVDHTKTLPALCLPHCLAVRSPRYRRYPDRCRTRRPLMLMNPRLNRPLLSPATPTPNSCSLWWPQRRSAVNMRVCVSRCRFCCVHYPILGTVRGRG